MFLGVCFTVSQGDPRSVQSIQEHEELYQTWDELVVMYERDDEGIQTVIKEAEVEAWYAYRRALFDFIQIVRKPQDDFSIAEKED